MTFQLEYIPFIDCSPKVFFNFNYWENYDLISLILVWHLALLMIGSGGRKKLWLYLFKTVLAVDWTSTEGISRIQQRGFSRSSVGKESTCSNAGDQGSIPGSGRSPGEGNGNPLLPGASVRKPARDKVMRKEADIRKACSDFRDPSGNS